ncbi:MAG: hypothetical protein M1840_007937 [Geoglossum simile]|nr:MAG: hypothetical protein M1840_007937 [Geoglossum simile]
MENLEPFFTTAITTISQINGATPGSLYQYEQHARAAASYIDRSQLMLAPARLDEQIWVVDSLQKFTQGTSATSGVREVALWCEMQWNRILQCHVENLAALQGLGSAWFFKAREPLARIQVTEGSLSSGSSSDDEAEAERLRHTQDYVEARALLMSATDFLRRAVGTARRTGRLTGSLLVTSAEANIHLGNVSYRSQSLPYFEDAVRSLREASELPGVKLADHLSL